MSWGETIALITESNPKWEDLAASWHDRLKPDGKVHVEPLGAARDILRR